MISYGQNREDVLLNRLFAADYRGFYVDVGASHPTQGSVTAHFYALGWSGINVEPSCSFELLACARPRDVNLQIALSRSAGQALFHEFPDAPGVSTFSPELARHGAEKLGLACAPRMVSVETLAEVCRAHVRGPIDFMSIDVEGHERDVLEGADWKAFRPRVLVIEATRPHTPESTHQQWEQIVLEAGYLFAIFDGLNRFYVRTEDRELLPRLAVPANVFDEFITYTEHCSMAQAQELKVRLDTMEQMGPLTLGIARRLNRMEQRFPRVSRRLQRARQSLRASRRGP